MSQEERIKKLEAKLKEIKNFIAGEADKTAHGDDPELYESGDPWGGEYGRCFCCWRS